MKADPIISSNRILMVVFLILAASLGVITWHEKSNPSKVNLPKDDLKIRQNVEENIQTPEIVPSFQGKTVYNDMGESTRYLYGIAEAPERSTDIELFEALYVMLVMDSDLKTGKTYEWMSKAIIDAAKSRFESLKQVKGSNGSRKLDPLQDQDRLRYDDFKFWIDSRGDQRLGVNPLSR